MLNVNVINLEYCLGNIILIGNNSFKQQKKNNVVL